MRLVILSVVGFVTCLGSAAQAQDLFSPNGLYDWITGYETVSVAEQSRGPNGQPIYRNSNPGFDPARPLASQVSFETEQSLFGSNCGTETCDSGTCNSRCSSDCNSWCEPMVPNMIGDGGLLQPLDPGLGFNSMLGLPAKHMSKVAENNSAIPRNRLAFGYNFLGRSETGQINSAEDKRDLQEFRLTYERLLSTNRLSFELILPLYYTTEYNVTDSPVGTGIYPLNGEFGDVAFGLKGLVVDGETFKLSTGIRVEAPTTDEYQTNTVGATQIIRDNVWHFTPYVAILVNPAEAWFLQAFGSYRLNSDDLVASGNALPTEGIREPTYLMIDVALGHWLYTNPDGKGLKAFVPTIELHYTTTPEPYQHVASTNLWNDTSYGHTDYLNLTFGSTAYFGSNLTIGNGFVVPLRTNSNTTIDFDGPTDRTFDWAMMLNVNYFYGR